MLWADIKESGCSLSEIFNGSAVIEMVPNNYILTDEARFVTGDEVFFYGERYIAFVNPDDARFMTLIPHKMIQKYEDATLRKAVLLMADILKQTVLDQKDTVLDEAIDKYLEEFKIKD